MALLSVEAQVRSAGSFFCTGRETKGIRYPRTQDRMTGFLVRENQALRKKRMRPPRELTSEASGCPWGIEREDDGISFPTSEEDPSCRTISGSETASSGRIWTGSETSRPVVSSPTRTGRTSFLLTTPSSSSEEPWRSLARPSPT